MLSCLCAFLAFSAVVSGLETTKTKVLCQTQLGETTAYNVPTHTTTITTTAPVITIAFTTGETITITPENQYTFNRTDTSVTTVTKTVTEKLTGSIFSTTLTKYEYDARFHGYTETVETAVSTSAIWTANHRILAPEGFRPINATATTTTSGPIRSKVPTCTGSSCSLSSVTPSTTRTGSGTLSAASSGPSTATSSGANTLAKSGKEKMVVYIFKDGMLVPTEVGDIAGMLDGSALDAGLAGGKGLSGAGVVGVAGVGAGPAIHAADAPSKGAGSSETTRTATSGASASDTKIAPTVTDLNTVTAVTTIPSTNVQIAPQQATEPASPHRHVHDKRDAAPDPRYEKVTRAKGLQGVISVNPVFREVAFPTMVSCTKIFVKESTIYRPDTTDAVYVAATPVTNYVTTLSTLLVTSTVPDRKPFKTVSFITTSTLTTTSTFLHTSTTTNIVNFTITSTTTSYAACATDNFLGPFADGSSSHIVNIYNNGLDRYTSFAIGYSRNAEECCIECQVAGNEIPCMGSVFTGDRCLLLTDLRGKCYPPKDAPGVFVTMSRGEVDRWTKEHDGQLLPEFVLSNGPCGYFHNGGPESW